MNTRCGKSFLELLTPSAVSLAVFVVFALLYALSCQRGIGWGDSAMFQARVLAGDRLGANSLALAHPLYFDLARVLLAPVPAAFVPFAVNALSGLWAALALAVFQLVARRLGANAPAALLATVTLGLAPAFWRLACLAEVYTLSVAFLVLEALSLVKALGERDRRAFAALAPLNGLHFAVHGFALLAGPVYLGAAVWLGRRLEGAERRRFVRSLVLFPLAWTLAAAPLLAPAAAQFLAGGATIESFVAVVRDVLVGGYGAEVAGGGALPWKLTFFNWALAAFSVAGPGWWWAWHLPRAFGPLRADRLAVAALLAVHFVFWARYRVADQVTFILPTLTLAALLLSVAMNGMRRARWWFAAVVVAAVALPIVAARTARTAVVRAEALPYRDESAYFILPWKFDERSAERFVRDAAALPPRSFIYAYETERHALEVASRLGRLAPDVGFGATPPAERHPQSRWEVRPHGAYRLSPPELTIVGRKGSLYALEPGGAPAAANPQSERNGRTTVRPDAFNF